jgi:hypothetical protein
MNFNIDLEVAVFSVRARPVSPQEMRFFWKDYGLKSSGLFRLCPFSRKRNVILFVGKRGGWTNIIMANSKLVRFQHTDRDYLSAAALPPTPAISPHGHLVPSPSDLTLPVRPATTQRFYEDTQLPTAHCRVLISNDEHFQAGCRRL